MPIQSFGHDKWWRARANPPPIPGVQGDAGYPLWQSSVLGMMVMMPPWLTMRGVWRWIRWYVWLVWRLFWLDAEQRAVATRVITMVEHEAWPRARSCVRACATTPGFNHPEMWVKYSRLVKEDMGQAQNLFRHMKALYDLAETTSRLRNPDLHLLVELAYQGFAYGPDERIKVSRADI